MEPGLKSLQKSEYIQKKKNYEVLKQIINWEAWFNF